MNKIASMTMRGLALTAAVGATVAATLLVTGQASGDPAAGVPTKDRAAIEQIVREYILAHPEIIPEAMNGLEARTVAKTLAAHRSALETPFAGAVAGNPNGDVRLVVFFDYACPYCKAAHADVAKLIASDPKLKVVFRDFPVLGEPSTEAAMASLSAARQGKYMAFHDDLFGGSGRLSHERTLAAATAAGLNAGKTAKDMTAPDLKAEVAKNLDLGRELQLTGTPSYVIGDRVLMGMVGYDALKAAVAQARAAKS